MEFLHWDLFGVSWLGTGLVSVLTVFTLLIIVLAVRRTRSQMRVASTSPPHFDPHGDIEGPGSGVVYRKRKWLDRVAPLFYEKSEKGTWKLSLGRVSFWLTMVTFLSMCILSMVSLGNQHTVNSSMATLYLGVLSMLFLTNIGLLAYNLGSKFTEPMKSFINSWSQRGLVATPSPLDDLPNYAAIPKSESVEKTDPLIPRGENPPTDGAAPPNW